MEKKIYQVDAFTHIPFGGNPAGVVPDATGLTDRQMQKIAREMNLSETAFVTPIGGEEADYEVRFFTPEQEVDLCGHATIGTFFALAHKSFIDRKGDKVVVRQKTRAGILPVEIYFHAQGVEKVMMTQAKPKFMFEIPNIGELAEIMGVRPEDMGLEGHEVLPQAISTGLPDIILPVRSLRALKEMSPNKEQLIAYSNRLGVVGVHAFALEAEESGSTLSCRNFGPAVGIDEEAATGTSNGALGAYLVQNNIFPYEEGMTIVSEQGYGMGRPSQIIVRLEGTKEDLIVKVGGKAVIMIEGTIHC